MTYSDALFKIVRAAYDAMTADGLTEEQRETIALIALDLDEKAADALTAETEAAA